MNVVMVGAGYVGLVSGACFSEFGASVTCIDVNEERIRSLKKGEVPIYEPGLEDLVTRNISAGRLSFELDFSPISAAVLVFIAVGTPTRHGDGHADLTYVYAAAKELAKHLVGYTVVVDKSTVPVGTARQVARLIHEANPEADFDVASNPEFLREGAAIADFMRPDRVVIGLESERAEEKLRELYRPLNLIETPIVVTGLESAELIKYAANAFLATKISFINEMSALCEAVGADVHAIAKGMGVGRSYRSKILTSRSGLRWFVFSQGHRRIGAHRTGARHPLSHRGGGCRGECRTARAYGQEDTYRPRWERSQQIHCSAWTHLQARNR